MGHADPRALRNASLLGIDIRRDRLPCPHKSQRAVTERNEEQVRQPVECAVSPTKAVFSHFPPSEVMSDLIADRHHDSAR
jgi:hypothetical protein